MCLEARTSECSENHSVVTYQMISILSISLTLLGRGVTSCFCSDSYTSCLYCFVLDLFVFMFLSLCLCLCVSRSVSVSESVAVSICESTRMSVCVCCYLYVCLSVFCVNICVCVCMCVCMCVCIHVCVHEGVYELGDVWFWVSNPNTSPC